jgi:hypothetical protein
LTIYFRAGVVYCTCDFEDGVLQSLPPSLCRVGCTVSSKFSQYALQWVRRRHEKNRGWQSVCVCTGERGVGTKGREHLTWSEEVWVGVPVLLSIRGYLGRLSYSQRDPIFSLTQ